MQSVGDYNEFIWNKSKSMNHKKQETLSFKGMKENFLDRHLLVGGSEAIKQPQSIDFDSVWVEIKVNFTK